MEVSKFRKAMRPKKYLTRDFVVYQDPKRLEARSEMQAGGVVEREGFEDGTKIQKEFLINFIKENQGVSNKVKADKLNKLGYINLKGGPITESMIEMFVTRNPDLKGKGKVTFASIEDLKQEATPKQLTDFELGLIDENTFRKRVTIGRGDKKKTPEYKREAAKRRYKRVMADPERKAKMKETQARSAEKRYLEKGMFPPAKNAKDAFWRDLLRSADASANTEGRVTWITERPKKFPRSVFENLELMDNKIGKKITYQNLTTHPEYKNAIKAYEAKDIIKQTKLPENIRKRLTFQRGEGGMKDTIAIQHNEGLAKNPFNTSLSIQQENRAEASLRVKLARDFDNATTLSEKKQAVKNFTTGLAEQAPNIASQPGKKTYGQSKNLKGIVSAALSDLNSKDLTDIISTLAPGCKLKYADGGRVNYSTGSDCYNRGLEMLKQASQGDKTTAQKVGQSLKQFTKATGKLARFVELPLEIALEGLLIGWDTTFNAKPLAESIKDNGIVTRAIFSDFQTSGEQDRAANIAKQNPQAAKYVEAKEALDKYNKLKNTINTFKDDLASADNYQNAVVKFEEYENEIEDKIPQYKAMLTPGSPEYEAFKEARIGLARDRVEKTYGAAQDMEELMQPFEGATDVADIQKAKAEELQGDIENVSSTYNFGPTFEEFKKETLPRLYELSNKKQTSATDAMLEPLLKSQYNKNLKLFSRPEFSGGGLTRRGFLKVIGALTALAAVAKTGVMKLTSPVAKKVLKDAPTGTPDWFAPLVEKIMKEGVDESGKLGTIERETVTVLRNPKLDEAGNPMYVESLQKDGTVEKLFAKYDAYILSENSDTGKITVSINSADIGANGDFVDFTITPQRVTGITDDGKPIIEGGEFTIAESRATGRMTGPDEVDIELDEYITNDLDDVASNWHSVEEFATGKTNKKAQIEKQKRKEQIENDPAGDIEDRGGTMDNYAEYFDEDEMKYGFND